MTTTTASFKESTMNAANIQIFAGRWNDGCAVKTYDGLHQCWLRYVGRRAQVARSKCANIELDYLGGVQESDWVDAAVMPTRAEDVAHSIPDSHAPVAIAAAIERGVI